MRLLAILVALWYLFIAVWMEILARLRGLA